VHAFEARSNAGLAGYQPVPIERLRVYVPHQRAYPAIFAARLTTRASNFDGSVGSDPVEQVLVFAAHDERSPWTVVAAPFVVRGLSLPEFSLRADGFSELSSPGDRVAIKPERLAGAYAAAFDKALAGTAVAAPFTADPFTDAYLKNVRDGVSRFAGNGLTYQLFAAGGAGDVGVPRPRRLGHRGREHRPGHPMARRVQELPPAERQPHQLRRQHLAGALPSDRAAFPQPAAGCGRCPLRARRRFHWRRAHVECPDGSGLPGDVGRAPTESFPALWSGTALPSMFVPARLL
jgi:hypothetical protein